MGTIRLETHAVALMALQRNVRQRPWLRHGGDVRVFPTQNPRVPYRRKPLRDILVEYMRWHALAWGVPGRR
jgi:hypothetical protein